jgi:hypothetical protein
MSDAVDKLVALKEQCQGADESDEDHAAHAAELEAAYLAVQQETSGAPEAANPGDQPGEYPLTADVQVTGAASSQ